MQDVDADTEKACIADFPLHLLLAWSSLRQHYPVQSCLIRRLNPQHEVYHSLDRTMFDIDRLLSYGKIGSAGAIEK